MAMVFVHYRAANIAFTYDECWSFNAFARADWTSTFWNLDPVANNHILHSLLMKISWILFGASEYSLRLPVLISHFFFLIISYKIVRSFFPKYGLWVFFALNLQPYLLDYYVAARGYGLAITFMFYSIYYLLRYWDFQDRKYLLGLGFFASLSIWANFTFLLVFTSLLAIGFGTIIYKGKWELKHWVSILLFPTIMISMLYKPLQRLIEKGELFYGGIDGFYSDTVLSLSKRILYDLSDNPILLSIFPTIILASCLLSIKVIFQHWKNNSTDRIHKLSLFSLIFLGPILGSILLHYILGKPYLIERTALFILPLAILQLFATIESFEGNSRTKGLKMTLVWSLSALFFANFIQSINFTYIVDFKEHADTRKALLNLRKIRSVDQQDYFTLGKSKYMNATINYYRFKEQLKFIPGADLKFCNENGPYPYYYLFEEDVECVSGLNLELIEFFPISKTYLFRNQDYIKRIKKIKD